MNQILNDRQVMCLAVALMFIAIALIYKFFIQKKEVPKKVFTAHLTLAEQVKEIVDAMQNCNTLLDIYAVRGKIHRLQRLYSHETEVVEKCEMWLEQLSTQENNMVFKMSKIELQ